MLLLAKYPWHCWFPVAPVMLITSVPTVTTTKVTVLSFPLFPSNKSDFSQKGSYVSFWHQQRFIVTVTFPCWTSSCVSQWPPGQVLQLLLRLWPPCFFMQSCKKRWCLHLPTAVKNRACPGVAPSLSNHCTPWPLQALLSWAISRLEAGTRLLAQVHSEISQHSSVQWLHQGCLLAFTVRQTSSAPWRLC